MVSARDVLVEAERQGARFRVVGDRLEATPKVGNRALHDAIGRRKGEIIALLRERDSACATDAVLFAQALLRQGCFPTEAAPCPYHCGYPHERCRRCGGRFAEHQNPTHEEPQRRAPL